MRRLKNTFIIVKVHNVIVDNGHNFLQNYIFFTKFQNVFCKHLWFRFNPSSESVQWRFCYLFFTRDNIFCKACSNGQVNSSGLFPNLRMIRDLFLLCPFYCQVAFFTREKYLLQLWFYIKKLRFLIVTNLFFCILQIVNGLCNDSDFATIFLTGLLSDICKGKP